MSHSTEMKKTSWDKELQAKFVSGFGSPSSAQVAVAERLFNFLGSQPISVSETVIMSSVTGKKTTKVNILRSLVELNIVFRSQSGGKGNPFQYHTCKDGVDAGNNLSLPISQDETATAQLFPSKSPDENSDPPSVAAPQSQANECRPIYKRLKLPDGAIIEVTKEEFDRIVDFYRNLHAQALAHPNLLSTEKKK